MVIIVISPTHFSCARKFLPLPYAQYFCNFVDRITCNICDDLVSSFVLKIRSVIFTDFENAFRGVKYIVTPARQYTQYNKIIGSEISPISACLFVILLQTWIFLFAFCFSEDSIFMTSKFSALYFAAFIEIFVV